MSTGDNTAPVYGPPNRNNYAELVRGCPRERPIPATVQTSNDRYQRALLGCYISPIKFGVDGAVAASLTFREQRPPKPPFRCPDRCANTLSIIVTWGYRGGRPTAVRPSDPALCGSCPLVIPYYCRLGDLLCYFVYIVLCVHYCLCISVFSCFRSLLCLL